MPTFTRCTSAGAADEDEAAALLAPLICVFGGVAAVGARGDEPRDEERERGLAQLLDGELEGLRDERDELGRPAGEA